MELTALILQVKLLELSLDLGEQEVEACPEGRILRNTGHILCQAGQAYSPCFGCLHLLFVCGSLCISQANRCWPMKISVSCRWAHKGIQLAVTS